ncbi:MAG: putative signaling protein, partial [Pseudonocardiales bacterium]|nr:putative signaling protein [Pseudonocardiales bacterium]
MRGEHRVEEPELRAGLTSTGVADRARPPGDAWRTSSVIAIGLLLVGVYFVVPGIGLKDGVYSIVGIGAVACILASTRGLTFYNRVTGTIFASAIGCFVAGDGVADIYNFVLHREPPTPSIADALYLAGYPLLITAVARMSRATSTQQSRENRVDAGVVTVGALALTWQLLMSSYAHDGEISLTGKLVTLAYPVMDIGVLFIVVNGLLFVGSRRVVDLLVAASMTSMLVADFFYDILVQRGTYATGHFLDAGWLVSYVLIAAAAFHARIPTIVAPADTERETRRRLPVVALVGLIAPGILLVTSLTGQMVDVPLMAAGSIVIFGLIVVRMTWLLNRLGQ